MHVVAPMDYSILHSNIENALEKDAPLKQRNVRGNNKQHVKTKMRRAIMLRTRHKKKRIDLEEKTIIRNINNRETWWLK